MSEVNTAVSVAAKQNFVAVGLTDNFFWVVLVLHRGVVGSVNVIVAKFWVALETFAFGVIAWVVEKKLLERLLEFF